MDQATSSRRTLATYGVKAKQCAAHWRDFPRHISKPIGKRPTPRHPPPQTINTLTRQKQKKRPHPLE